MKTKLPVLTGALLLMLLPLDGHSKGRNLFAVLDGFQEVPSVLTEGSGNFRGRINHDGSISFVLDVRNLTDVIIAAHIHFAQEGVNGPVVVTLCGGPPPAVVPLCDTRISGTITPELVSGGGAAQGLEAGDLQGLLKVLRNGSGYINVHTPPFPAGEIRGKIR